MPAQLAARSAASAARGPTEARRHRHMALDVGLTCTFSGGALCLKGCHGS
jgi:hypothetical protein